jgi:glyoxylase-like metal-dependent hydrolase (beta-lactamase superfamily II)
VCLWDAEHRLLFADDHLLARTSPNPFLELVDERTTRRALVQYLHSIARVRALDVEWVLPGHGPPFQGTARRSTRCSGSTDGARRSCSRRSGPGRGRRWSCPTRLFGPQEGARLYLTLSEVVGNLEVLEDARRVRQLSDGPIDRWALSG